MNHIEDVENPYWPGEISHSKYRCECGQVLNVNGFGEMWNDDPPRKVRFKKMPEIGDRYDDVIEPIN